MVRQTVLRVGAVAVGGLVALIGLGGCTSSGGGADTAFAPHAGGGAAAPAPADRDSQKAAPSAAQGALAGEVAIASAKIRTAQMTVVVKRGTSVAQQADTAAAIALGHGGEVDSDNRESGRHAAATLILRVPPEDLPAVLGELSKLGVEKARHLSTEDVTSKVADVDSRVASARDAIARLRTLYSRATKVSDVINIESELSGRESDLESLEAQQRALAAQTSTATVTLSLSSAIVPARKPPAEHHRSGFVGGLQNGWDAFVQGASWVATALGALLPFALLALVAALVARVLWPRLRPAPPPAPTPAPPQP